MNIWNQVQSALRKWLSPGERKTETLPEQHLLEASRNIRELIEDTHIPSSVRAELSEEFEEISAISSKLRESEIHIAAFGRVGVGKSSLLNALLQKQMFSTSPLHGETREEDRATWQSHRDGNVVLIDSPGIDELEGEERTQLAQSISRRADIVLMLCEGDLTRSEFSALERLLEMNRTVLLVLNKADRYTANEKELLLQRLRDRCGDLLPGERILSASADPRPDTVIEVDSAGRESERQRRRAPDTAELKSYLWSVIESEGQSLAALNAALFASELDQKIASRIVMARKKVAEKIIRKYCITKGLLVAFNPVPVADLLAAAGTDIALVIHLGEVYGFRLSRREASKLLLTISAQLVALMGAYWGVNLIASALKTASAGLSTALTATSQGALAWYATYLTGKMAQTWFSKGKSWGNTGPRDTARSILAALDRDSLLKSARDDILARMKVG
jgi:small GTP-binding protein